MGIFLTFVLFCIFFCREMNEPEGERQLTTSTSSLTLASNTSSVNDIDYTLETSDSPAIDDTVMEDVNVESTPATNPTSYLGNAALYVDNKEFFIATQDQGK